MAPSEAGVGHRASALVRLRKEDECHLRAGVFQAGGRSVMYRFPNVDQGVGDMFGAVIEDVELKEDGRFWVRLWFWDELAAFYAVPGVRFQVWYGHTVGEGEVGSA